MSMFVFYPCVQVMSFSHPGSFQVFTLLAALCSKLRHMKDNIT
jgi:hypothetical protein